MTHISQCGQNRVVCFLKLQWMQAACVCIETLSALSALSAQYFVLSGPLAGVFVAGGRRPSASPR